MDPIPGFIDLAVRPTAVFLAATVFSLALRHRSAAARHVVWSVALVAALLVPFTGFLAPAVAVLPTAGPGPASPVGPWLPLPLLWLAGAAAIAGVRIRRLARLRQAERDASPPTSTRLATLLDSARSRLGVRRSVRLLLGGPGDMPVTWGWRQARILLPSAACGWPDRQAEVVLLHELAHVRRSDILLQRVAELTSILLWFNPLTWYALRRLAVEREYACDDAVLRSGVEGPEYAHELLALTRTLRDARGVAAAAFSGRSQMRPRVLAILDETKRRSTWPGAAPSLVAALGVFVALSAGSLRSRPLAAMAAQAVSPAAVSAVDGQAGDRFSFHYRFNFAFDFHSRANDGRIRAEEGSP